MKLKYYLHMLCILLLIAKSNLYAQPSGTANGNTGNSLREFSTSTLISLPVPQHFDGKINYLDQNSKISIQDIGAVTHDNSLLLSFPNVVSSVTIYQVDQSGSLSLFGNSLSAKNSVYEVIYDYTQTQSIELDNHTFVLVGISVRMVAKVQTKSQGINLSSIEGLGIAATNNKISGSLEVRSVGISWDKLNTSIPVTTDLSPASISNALQTVATIKSHIYDSDVKITPQFLAVSQGVQDSSSNAAGTAAQSNYDKIINPKKVN